MAWQSAAQALDPWTGVRILVAAGVYAAALLAIGSRLFLHAFAGLNTGEATRIARGGAVAAALGLGLVLAQWPLQAGYLGGSSLQAAVDPTLLGMVHASPQGDRMLLAVTGLGLLLASMASRRSIAAWPGGMIGVAGISLLLLAFVQVGHTRGEPRGVLAALLCLHLLAVAFWMAALAPLFRLASATDAAQAGTVLARFGRIGMLFVPLLVAAGLGLAWLLLGGAEAMFTTAYGQLLLGKLGLVTALLALAALNKLRLVPALARGDARARRRLRLSIVAEALLMAAVLLWTAALTTLASPRDPFADAPPSRHAIPPPDHYETTAGDRA